MKLYAFTLIFTLYSSLVSAQEKPNIIFILADDLGMNTLPAYGNTFMETPHIDQLAAKGMKFTRAYANCPTCKPSRAAIITGQYAPRTQIYRVVDRQPRT
jgi:arylsulfatase A-like enzyme